MSFFSIFNSNKSSISSVNGSININGKSYKGNNIVIDGDSVYINGNIQEGFSDCKQINITINGSCGDIENGAGKITVSGDAKNISTGSGDIKCGRVNGSVKTGSGDVTCGNVSGNIQTGSGDIYKK